MFRLIGFELKRIARNRFVWLIFIIFLLTDVYKIYREYKGLNNPVSGSEKIYEKIRGKVTNEKAQFLIDNYGKLSAVVNDGTYSTDGNQKGTYTGYVYGDYSEFERYYNQYKYIYDYPERMNRIVAAAKKNTKDRIHNSKFEILKNRKIIKDYSNREIRHFYEMEHMQLYLQYDFSTIFLFLLVIAGVSGILYYDRKGKVLYLVKVSRMGLHKSMIAKMTAICIYACIVTAFTAVADLIFFSVFFDLEGWNQPLYALSGYADTSVSMTVLGCVFFQMLLKMFGAVYWGLTVFFLSKKCKRNSWTIVSAVTLFLCTAWLCLNHKIFYNPVALFAPMQIIKKFDVVNLMGFPVYYYKEVIIVVLLLTAGLFFSGCHNMSDID